MEQEKQLHWFPGHMMKALRAIEAKLPIIDVVIEVLDARAPVASRSMVLENLIKNKTRIVVLNKADLADEKISAEWKRYFEEQNFHVLLTKTLQTKLKPELVKIIELALEEKMKKQRAKGIKNPKIKVLIMGLPNVGKSTIINNLIQKNIVKAADSPGVTRGQQWIKLNNTIDLLDCPGILPPKVDNQDTSLLLTLIKSIPNKHLFLEEISFYALKFIINNYYQNLNKFYQIDFNFDKLDNSALHEYFILIAKKYNFKLTNNQYNITRAMNLFIHDLQQGKLGLISFDKPNK